MKFEEFRKGVEIKASVRPGRYVVAKVANCSKLSEKIFAMIKDYNETTIVVEENHELNIIEEEKFFKIISFETKLPFNLVGFLAYITGILANEGISILAISAYSTDHILIKENDLNQALKILKNNGVKITKSSNESLK
jgi:hypothetical protein